MPILLICVEGSATETEAQACREQVEALRSSRVWTYPPGLVNQVDDIPITSPDDLPSVRTTGLSLGLPEPEEVPDEDAVRKDVAAVVEAMSGLARDTGIEFIVEYREEAVGFLDGGPGDGRIVADFFGDS